MIDLLDHWTKQNLVEPHLIIRRPQSNMVPELKKRGWNYYPIYYTNWSQRNPSKNSESLFRNARENAKAVAEIEKLIKKIKPELVMTNTIVSPWAAIAAHFQQVPHVWFIREYGDIDHQHVFELGRKKMLQDIDTLSDLVVTNSKTLAQHVEKYINENKVHTLYTPFDLEFLERKSNQTGKKPFNDQASLKLVITGRIAPSKGQDVAARAVGELNKQGFNAELCIIGTPADPSDADALNQAISEYGIADKVHLVGHQTNPLAIVKQADIGIMASQQEAFGRVTFEYMAIGRPVVGTNSGATPELIDDGINGYLYKQGDTRSLTQKLLKYARQRDLIDRHGVEAKNKAKKMMKGKYTADNLYEVVQNLLANNKVNKNNPPLNFSRRWLDYPLLAQEYIDESRVLSLRRLLYSRMRSKLKAIYLLGPGLVKLALLPLTPLLPKKIRPKKMEKAYEKRQNYKSTGQW